MSEEEKEELLKLEKWIRHMGLLKEANLIDRLQKENAELKEQRDNAIKLRNELIEEQKITCISKNEIREVLKDIYFYYGQNNDTFLVDKIRKELLGDSNE